MLTGGTDQTAHVIDVLTGQLIRVFCGTYIVDLFRGLLAGWPIRPDRQL